MLVNDMDLAHAFSSDGVQLFRQGKSHTVWPHVLTTFNLAPEI